LVSKLLKEIDLFLSSFLAQYLSMIVVIPILSNPQFTKQQCHYESIFRNPIASDWVVGIFQSGTRSFASIAI